jgi:hypothetical protein
VCSCVAVLGGGGGRRQAWAAVGGGLERLDPAVGADAVRNKHAMNVLRVCVCAF